MNITQPTPAEVKVTREKAGLTQEQAGTLVHASKRTWQNWESEGNDSRTIPLSAWELFLIKATPPEPLNLVEELKSEFKQRNHSNIDESIKTITELVREQHLSGEWEWLKVQTQGEFAEMEITAWAESNGFTVKKGDNGFSTGIFIIWGKTPLMWSNWDCTLKADGTLSAKDK